MRVINKDNAAINVEELAGHIKAFVEEAEASLGKKGDVAEGLINLQHRTIHLAGAYDVDGDFKVHLTYAEGRSRGWVVCEDSFAYTGWLAEYGSREEFYAELAREAARTMRSFHSAK